jgi:hypothetical protein
MKKYTTWEAIKMLSENSKLEFNLYTNGEEHTDKSLRTIGSTVTVKAMGTYNDHLRIETEWVLVQQPVSFMEAVKAYHEGKTIYSISIDNSVRNTYSKQSAVSNYLIDACGNTITSHEILSYKWFIEDGEGDYDR